MTAAAMTFADPTSHRVMGPPAGPPEMKESVMSLPRITTRDEWLLARTDLLAKEKDLTARRDALNVDRRNLPMVEVEKDYRFVGPDGTVGLLDLFEGRAQLLRLPLHVPSGVGGGAAPVRTAGTR